jgi:hypothetical protein
MTVGIVEQSRIDETLKTFHRYIVDPFVTDFLREEAKKVAAQRATLEVKPKGKKAQRASEPEHIPITTYKKPQLFKVMRNVLLGKRLGERRYVLHLDALVAYVDRLQETGRQHIYLFQLQDAGLLARLNDAEEVRKLFGADVYGDGKLVWDAKKGPELVRVWQQGTRLFLKWIETRQYWSKEDPNAATAGDDDEERWLDAIMEEEKAEEEEEQAIELQEGDKQVTTRFLREERATSYFVVDLGDGHCELRIQLIRGRARDARQKQFATYRTAAERLLGVTLVGPTVLAPAIRRALIERKIDIVHCWAILPGGGKFDGKKGEFPPVDIRKLQAGVQIKFDWDPPEGGKIRVELDGRLDEILTSKPLVPEEHRNLLTQIERWREEGLDVFTHVDETPATPEPPKDWVEILKLALDSKKRPVGPAIQPGLDGAIGDYVRTHEAAPASTQFLTYIEEVAKRERLNYKREIEPVRVEEKWTFWLSVVAMILALLLFTAGTVLVFFAKFAIGTITALLGVLTGRGTWLIRSYMKHLRAKREFIQRQQRDSGETLLAIQTALAITDDDLRSRAMSEVTLTLIRRVTGGITTPAPPSPPSPAPSPA